MNSNEKIKQDAVNQATRSESFRQSTVESNGPAAVCMAHGCGRCGQPARVSRLKGYRNGHRIMKYYCLACSDRPGRVPTTSWRRGLRALNVPLMTFGLLFALFAAMFDLVPGFDGTHLGMGVYQKAGILAGASAILIGTMMRVDLVSIGGYMLLVLSLAADLVNIGRAPGVGWIQGGAIAISVAMILLNGIQRSIIRSGAKQRQYRFTMDATTDGA